MINTTEYMREYRKKNRDHLNAYRREYRKRNYERCRETERRYGAKPQSKARAAEGQRRRRRERRDEINAKAAKHAKKRYRSDEQYRIKCQLRSRLYSAVRGNSKAGSAVKLLGCSVDDFKRYLEDQFEDGMSWRNRSEWHIDHIKPLAMYDLSDPEQLAIVCHYTNMRPMWANQNRSKGAKLFPPDSCESAHSTAQTEPTRC